MKKFLTVLLALSVVFTYTVGSAFAAGPSESEENALKELAQDVKGDFAYYPNGYMKATDNAAYLSKSVVEAGVDKIVDKYMADISEAPETEVAFKAELFDQIDVWDAAEDGAVYGGGTLTSLDYSKEYVFILDGKVLTEPTKYANVEEVKAAWEAASENKGTIHVVTRGTKYIYTTLLQEQYKVERDAAYDALSPDLSEYSAAVRKAIEEVIDAQTQAIEEAVKEYEASNKTSEDSTDAIDEFVKAVAAIEVALDQDTVADDNKAIADARKAVTKALNEKSEAFKEAAEDHYKTLTNAQAVARLASLDADVDKMVAFFEERIDATVLDEKNEKMDEADEVVKALKAIQTTLESTFKVNEKYKDDEFYKDLAVFGEADVLKVYAEKEAADMKAERNADGTYTYHAADVDVALATVLENIAAETYKIIASTGKLGFNKDTLVDKVFAAVEKTNDAYYALRKYKADSIDKVTTKTYSKGNWSYDRYDKVVALQKQATDDILKADTTAAIDQIVETAQAEMDKILTTDQINALNVKTNNRLSTLGYTGIDGVLDKYYDVSVGSKGYSADIKDGAIAAAVKVFENAVVAAEDKDITYAEIDKIIADNRDKALAAVANVKTVDELNAQAAALKAQFAALPKEVTIADKETILDAMHAFENYLEQPGTDKGDVSNEYLLENAMDDLMTLEVKAVKDQIRALPDTITVADEAAIEAARAACDALIDTYGNYDNGEDAFGANTGFAYYGAVLKASNENVLADAEIALENAKIKEAADKIRALGANPTKAEVETARAAYDALALKSKLSFNDELYADLLRAEAQVKANTIAAVRAFQISTTTELVKGKKMIVKWNVMKGDESAIDGYRVYYSTKKSNAGFKVLADVKGKKLNHTSIKSNVKKGTRVYYRVKAYKMIDGLRYLSSYSSAGHRTWK